MNTALKLHLHDDELSTGLTKLDDNELRNVNGGSPKAIAGWKAAAFLLGGTAAAVVVGVGATYLVYKGVQYLIK